VFHVSIWRGLGALFQEAKPPVVTGLHESYNYASSTLQIFLDVVFCVTSF